MPHDDILSHIDAEKIATERRTPMIGVVVAAVFIALLTSIASAFAL